MFQHKWFLFYVLMSSLGYSLSVFVHIARFNCKENDPPTGYTNVSLQVHRKNCSKTCNLSLVSTIKQYISLLSPINKVWRLIFDVKTHSGKHSAPNGGLEPPTLRLRVSCSTDWASQATLNSQFIFSINLGIFMFWFQSRHHRQQLYLTQRGSATVIHGRHSHYTGDAQRNTDVHR